MPNHMEILATTILQWQIYEYFEIFIILGNIAA